MDSLPVLEPLPQFFTIERVFSGQRGLEDLLCDGGAATKGVPLQAFVGDNREQRLSRIVFRPRMSVSFGVTDLIRFIFERLGFYVYNLHHRLPFSFCVSHFTCAVSQSSRTDFGDKIETLPHLLRRMQFHPGG